MRYFIWLLALLSFIVLSCESNDDTSINTCNVSNPIKDLGWFKEKIQELEQTRGFEAGDIYI